MPTLFSYVLSDITFCLLHFGLCVVDPLALTCSKHHLAAVLTPTKYLNDNPSLSWHRETIPSTRPDYSLLLPPNNTGKVEGNSKTKFNPCTRFFLYEQRTKTTVQQISIICLVKLLMRCFFWKHIFILLFQFDRSKYVETQRRSDLLRKTK